MKILHTIAHILLLVGGLNWGLYGLLDVDLVHLALQSLPQLAKVVYGLIGAAAIFEIVACKSCCHKSCS
jgi:uncharacterized membrane protein YuzA (DUF378 family)